MGNDFLERFGDGPLTRGVLGGVEGRAASNPLLTEEIGFLTKGLFSKGGV